MLLGRVARGRQLKHSTLLPALHYLHLMKCQATSPQLLLLPVNRHFSSPPPSPSLFPSPISFSLFLFLLSLPLSHLLFSPLSRFPSPSSSLKIKEGQRHGFSAFRPLLSLNQRVTLSPPQQGGYPPPSRRSISSDRVSLPSSPLLSVRQPARPAL